MELSKTDLISATQAALSGDWHGAHNIVQKYNHNTANWLHAVLHKIEGDAWNSQYWYAKTSGKQYEDFAEVQDELLEIQRYLASSSE